MLLIYGSTGYTGRLIVAEALARGLRPTLVARNADAVRAQAEALGLEWRAAPLDDAAKLDAALTGTRVVIHCAGPFAHTWRAMSDACMRAGAHYLDITGEIAVFEGLAARDVDAKAAGVMLMPGTGFDVVPSDCLAAHLAGRLPDATHLALAFQAAGGVSRGTSLTIIEGLGQPGAVRRNGKIVFVPQAWDTRAIDFGDGRPRETMTIGWGDVFTAYHSTGIPNIAVYTAVPTTVRLSAIASRHIGPVLRSGFVQRMLRASVKRTIDGPSAASRDGTASLLWGEATTASGATVTARLRAPNAYTLTAQTAVLIATKVLGGNAPPGFQTPARAYGAEVILEIPGVTRSSD
ncbi:MAG: saccharopine dehydrogenase NADP-binding domain-containing protein [Gemmatimonadota bacterium]|nr:saccharopine dehydrogenase NADP-binding domain-containing protein [Gemmatimonadota bacterium]